MHQIIICSHGPMAEAMIASASMLYGQKENCHAIKLIEDDTIQSFVGKIEEIMSHFTNKESNGTLIMCDIPGGTPYNCANAVALKHANTRVISGLNMMMLLEALLSEETTDSIDELATKCLNSAKDSCIMPSKSLMDEL